MNSKYIFNKNYYISKLSIETAEIKNYNIFFINLLFKPNQSNYESSR